MRCKTHPRRDGIPAGVQLMEEGMHLLVIMFLLWLVMRPRRRGSGIGCLLDVIILFVFIVLLSIATVLHLLLLHPFVIYWH